MMRRYCLIPDLPVVSIAWFAILFVGTAGAQHKLLWQGAVRPNRINVYSKPSTHESVVRTLGHGDVVDVVLEVRVSDFAWCRVAFPNEPEPIGYVLCFNLQQGKFKSDRNQGDSGAQLSSDGASKPRVLTNKDILDMNKAGLSSDILVASIKSSQCNFDTSPIQLQQLKSNGVPDAAILAMVQAPAGPAGQVETRSVASGYSTTYSSAVSPGMYVTKNEQSEVILGQAVTFERTGSRLVSSLTLHLKAAHDNIQLPGAHARTLTGPDPIFTFIPSQRETENGVTAGDLVLIKLEEHGDRRQIEVAALGAWRGSKGVSITHQLAIMRSERTRGQYEIKPAAALQAGEYALYLERGEGLPAMLYDFSVQSQER